MNNQDHLKQSLQTLEKPLTYSEWCDKFNVSSHYIEPTKYFQGNPSSGFQPLEVSSPIERLMKYLFSKE